MDTCLGFSKASSFAYIGCYCIVTVLLETMAFLGCYHDCRFSNVSTWHLQKLALSKDVCARDFAQVACKDSSMIAVVLWPKLGLAACLRIIGDNNFPSLNSYFGLPACSNFSLKYLPCLTPPYILQLCIFLEANAQKFGVSICQTGKRILSAELC